MLTGQQGPCDQQNTSKDGEAGPEDPGVGRGVQVMQGQWATPGLGDDWL